MKKIIIALACIALLSLMVSTSYAGTTRVRGYYKKNGTYVQPHYRSTPDSSKLNNWSTKGNVNPYTGKKGTIDPYKTYSPYKYKNPYSK